MTVEASNHGDECMCTARWKRTAWYMQCASVKLIVLRKLACVELAKCKCPQSQREQEREWMEESHTCSFLKALHFKNEGFCI